MVEWHHQHNGYEFEQPLEDSKGQREEPGVLQSMGLQTVMT